MASECPSSPTTPATPRLGSTAHQNPSVQQAERDVAEGDGPSGPSPLRSDSQPPQPFVDASNWQVRIGRRAATVARTQGVIHGKVVARRLSGMQEVLVRNELVFVSPHQLRTYLRVQIAACQTL